MADATQLVKEFKDAERAAKQSGEQINKNFTGQATKDIKAGEAAFRQAGVGMMAAAGAAAFGLYKTTQAASDLNEQVSQSGIVFKDAKGEIEEFAKSADAIGLSERAATQAANSFGIMFTKMGKGSDEAATMAVEFTKLAADLASFYNTTTDEAATALRSGLAGEMEPLKKYGIMLDDATLKQRAFDMGLTQTTTGVLPPLIKMQAAQAETLAQGAVAMGDATRTADGLAGRQRQLTADWENAQAALGEGLTPMLADAANGLSNMLEKANGLNEATGGNLGTIAGYGTVILGVAGAASFAIGSIRGMTENFTAAKGAMANWTAGYPRVQAMGASLGKVAAGAGAAAAGFLVMQEAGKALYNANFNIAADSQRVADALAAIGTGGSDLGIVAEDAQNLGGSLMVLQDNVDSLVNGAEFNGIPELFGFQAGAEENVQKYDAALSQLARTNAPAAREALARLSEAYLETGVTQETLDYAFADTLGTLADVESGVAGAADTTADFGAKSEEAAEAQKNLADQLERARSEYEKLLGLGGDLLGLSISYEAAVDGLGEALKENGLTFDVNTDKGRTNLSAVQEQTDAIIANGIAVLEQTGSVDAANAKINEQVDALRRQLQAAGLSEAQINNLVATMGLLPKDLETKVQIAGYDEAMLRMMNLAHQGQITRDAILGASGTNWAEISASQDALRARRDANVQAGRRAMGGPVYAGNSYLVGETGPELVHMGANGTVMNSSRTSAAMNAPVGGGGGSEIIQISLDGRVLAEYLREYDRGRR
jgi:hypothetical protein